MLVAKDNCTLSWLKGVEVERPEGASDRWKGIKHYDLVRGLLDECERRNWVVSNRQIEVSNNTSALAGSFALKMPGVAAGKGYQLSIGFLTDNCRKKSLRFYVGGILQDTGTGFITARVVLNKRHTQNLDLTLEIQDAFDEFHIRAKKVREQRTSLLSRKLKPSEYNRLLIQAGRAKLMPWSRLGRVDREYNHPQQIEFGTVSSWTLLCAFSQHVQHNPPLKQLEQLHAFLRMLPVTEDVAVAA